LGTGMLDVPVDPSTTNTLWRLSKGLPLYVRELLAAANESHELQLTGTGWHLDRVPVERSRLRDLMAERIRALPTDVQDALEVRAVAGALPLDDLFALVGDGPVSALEEAGLAAVDA